jgi:gluconate 5-dehydrogenase
MIEKKYGKIINITSIYGTVANTFMPIIPYHSSKGAVINFTRALAAEWAKYHISVNAIGPGFFESEFNRDDMHSESFLNYGKKNRDVHK